MVYIASGLGIVPIVDQVKAITPKGSSSVKVISVIWINDQRSDFDLAMEELENEYTKYSTKLAVSCILDDAIKNPIKGNVEVDEAVPYFTAGAMAVISGPKRFSEKVKAFLLTKGYPENCVCVLP
jgi:NAD(P)H-flavin reductase